MTTVLQQQITENYYISLSHENNTLIVEACPLLGDHTCGYPVAKMVYTLGEMDKAKRCYKRYIKNYR